MLGQSTDEDVDGLAPVELADAVLRQDVHHPRGDAAVGDDSDSLGDRTFGEFLLLEDDLGVAAEIAEVHPRLDRPLRELEVEVVGDRAHHRVALAHQRQDRLPIAYVERCRNQPLARVRREEGGQVVEAQVGEADLRHLGILQQVIGTRGALEPRAEDEHTHSVFSP
jgi:hypothetical protein